MYTSFVLFALSGFAAPSPAKPELHWFDSYGKARQQGASDKKPLAVFLSKGENGWDKVSRDGPLNPEVKKLLQEEYVCVFVDTSSDSGKQLASAFQLTTATGLVISNRTGDLQAFRYSGELSNSDLKRQLKKFSDPSLVVSSTETELREPVARPTYQSIPSFSGGGGC